MPQDNTKDNLKAERVVVVINTSWAVPTNHNQDYSIGTQLAKVSLDKL
jgi:hypothetical protein